MKSIRGLVFLICLFFTLGLVLNSINQTSWDGHAIFLNFEIEEKSENSLEEEEFRHTFFSDECFHDINVFYGLQSFYTSTYTSSPDIPPEYC